MSAINIKTYQDEIDKLKAENEKLRSQEPVLVRGILINQTNEYTSAFMEKAKKRLKALKKFKSGNNIIFGLEAKYTFNASLDADDIQFQFDDMEEDVLILDIYIKYQMICMDMSDDEYDDHNEGEDDYEYDFYYRGEGCYPISGDVDEYKKYGIIYGIYCCSPIEYEM
jgi:hypothetical protein